jgi:hypothetical protein
VVAVAVVIVVVVVVVAAAAVNMLVIMLFLHYLIPDYQFRKNYRNMIIKFDSTEFNDNSNRRIISLRPHCNLWAPFSPVCCSARVFVNIPIVK